MSNQRSTAGDEQNAPATVIVTAAEKGGVGKSSIAAGLGCGLALLGRRVLLVDLEYQGTLSMPFLESQPPPERSVAVLLATLAHGLQPTTRECVFRNCKETGVDLLAVEPSSVNRLPRVLASLPDEQSETLLAALLAPLRDEYDYIIVDTCPKLFDPLISLALYAATVVLIPAQLEGPAMRGIMPLLGRIESFKARNKELSVLGVVPSRVQEGRRATRDAMSALESLPIPLLPPIHESTEVNDAYNAGRPLLAPAGEGFRLRRRSKVREEFLELAGAVDAKLRSPK